MVGNNSDNKTSGLQGKKQAAPSTAKIFKEEQKQQQKPSKSPFTYDEAVAPSFLYHNESQRPSEISNFN